MTPAGNYRLNILRIYWDDETEPSVEVRRTNPLPVKEDYKIVNGIKGKVIL